jgi:hypothetical protein
LKAISALMLGLVLAFPASASAAPRCEKVYGKTLAQNAHLRVVDTLGDGTIACRKGTRGESMELAGATEDLDNQGFGPWVSHPVVSLEVTRRTVAFRRLSCSVTSRYDTEPHCTEDGIHVARYDRDEVEEIANPSLIGGATITGWAVHPDGAVAWIQRGPSYKDGVEKNLLYRHDSRGLKLIDSGPVATGPTRLGLHGNRITWKSAGTKRFATFR